MLTGGYDLSSVKFPEEDPLWADIVPTFRRLGKAELLAYDPSGKSIDGYGFTTIITYDAQRQGSWLFSPKKHGWVCVNLISLRKLSCCLSGRAGKVASTSPG